jgi:acyl-[acyl-carrier-protein]-phospholipid O-acyltransferase/long-chain-fatty-acid--[acyl-carrier-protein] ligase
VFHWLAWVAARLVYRVRAIGRANLPDHGPALIVSNHVSYVDWLVIMAASRRPVRFVIASQFLHNPWIGWLLRLAKVIPIERNPGPKSLRQTFKDVDQALTRGGLVCLFPEAYPTRNGTLLPFHRGFEKIVAGRDVPVIPTYLDQLWGSVFSYKGGRLFWKWPKRPRSPVTVSFGPPQPSTVTAAEVRQMIVEMSAGRAKARAETVLPLHRRFVRSAARHPFRSCLIDTTGAQPRMLNRGKVFAGAVCLSRWLKPKLGDVPMVGVWLPQSVGGVLTNLAIAFLHKTAVNLNYTAGGENIRSAARQCGLRHVLTSKRFLQRVPLDLGPDVEIVPLEDALAGITSAQRVRAFLSAILLPGWFLDWRLALRNHRPGDLATVIFSSGSTGEPKGVMLTQLNIASNVEAFVDHVDFTHRDRVLGVLPFFHSFGYTVTLWGALTAGATTVYHPDPRAAKEIGELCRTHGCTLMGATATFLRLYLRRCQPEDFKTMRLLVCGAEKLPPALVGEFQEKFGVEPLEGYGCTELSPVVSVNLPDVTVNGVTQVGRKIGTIGHPLPGIAARIVDTEILSPIGLDREGLLLVTGPNVMKGYLGHEDMTKAKVRDGWYDTGDVGKMDGDGFITLTGRLQRIAKIAGEMVPLELLEEEMHKALGTADRVFAVTAVPDKKRGERIVVLYVAHEGLDLSVLLKRLSERGLPNLWIPDERDFFRIPELPILGSGKLDLKRLKDLAAEKIAGRERDDR